VSRVADLCDQLLGAGPTDEVDARSRDVTGRYASLPVTKESLSRLKEEAQDKSKLVVIIADECHWGTEPNLKVKQSGADASDSSRSGANDWVRLG
jgi:hypothetical protein